MNKLKTAGIEVGQGRYYEEIIYSAVLIYNVVTNEIASFLKKYDLNPSKFNILMVIKHQGQEHGISQVEISRHLIVTASNMTKMIDKLQKEGLVVRLTHKTDRRVNVMKITPKGSKLLDQIWDSYNDTLTELTKHMNRDKQKQLSILLQEWLENIR